MARPIRRAAASLVLLAAAYLTTAYFVAPEFWRLRERGATQPGEFLTTTAQGIPADPVNLVLEASRDAVLRAFSAAGWNAADPITARTSVEIGLSVVFDRPYADAPVSTLLYRGRAQDLAFEKASGISPDQRHHVRFWQTDAGRFVGAASFDRGVGLSRDTGAITHHIAPDLDRERDLIVASLREAGWVAALSLARGVGPGSGRNGGGDPYVTDGDVAILTLADPRR